MGTSRVELPRRTIVLIAVLCLGLVIPLGLARAQDGAPAHEPLDTFAFVARSDNPVDALAASAIAGQLGGYIVLTEPQRLGDDARAALLSRPPAVVVLAGGTVALSEQVALDVQAALPDSAVRRVAGASRTATARELIALLDELGVGRPLLTAAAIEGDVDVRGVLHTDRLGVSSTEMVDNLNAALLGGNPAGAFRLASEPVDAATLGGNPAGAFRLASEPVDAATLGGNPAEAFAGAPEPVSATFTCPGSAFVPMDGTTDYAGTTLNRVLRGEGPHGFVCHASLPPGARLTNMRIRAFDTSDRGGITEARLRSWNVTGNTPVFTSVVEFNNVTGYSAVPGSVTAEQAMDRVVGHGANEVYVIEVVGAWDEPATGLVRFDWVKIDYLSEHVPTGTPPAP